MIFKYEENLEKQLNTVKAYWQQFPLINLCNSYQDYLNSDEVYPGNMMHEDEFYMLKEIIK